MSGQGNGGGGGLGDVPSGRAHPEGAPGAFDAFYRAMMGDANYETQQELQQKVALLALQAAEYGVEKEAAKAALWKMLPFTLLVLTVVACFCAIWWVVVT